MNIENIFKKQKKLTISKDSLIMIVSLALVLLIATIFMVSNRIQNSTVKYDASMESVNMLLDQNLEKEAISVLERIIKKSPDDKVAAEKLAQIYFANGEIDKFLEISEKHEIDSSSNDNQMAQYFRSLEDDDSAIEHYKLAIQNAPNNVEPYISFASFWQAKGDFSQALGVLERGMEKEIDSSKIYSSAASIAMKMNDRLKAINYANLALSINSKDVVAKAILEKY